MYTTTKRALSLWIRKNASAPEWAGARIALNALAPGVIRTPMTEYGFSSQAGREIFQEFRSMHPPATLKPSPHWIFRRA